LSPKLLSFKRSVLFSFFFLALIVSAVYLKAGDEIEVISELDIVLSSIWEECDSWISRVSPSLSWNGGSSSGYIWQATSGAIGLLPSARHESDSKSDYDVFDPTSFSPSVSLILDFDSSVSTSLFRTWGTLTLQGGSTLPYLILNATLWDEDQLVERTRYMMIDVKPGKSRDFDICENCRLSPERGYSCLLEVEEPEALFVSERRDCLAVDDDPLVDILDGSGEDYGREAASEKGSIDSRPPSGSTKAASTSSSSKPVDTSQEVEDPSEDLELEDDSRSNDSGFVDLESEDEDLISDFSPGDQKITETEVGTDYEDDQVVEARYVGSTTSDKYHRPDCSYAKKIKSENKIFFSDVLDAQKKGYSACKVCSPQ